MNTVTATDLDQDSNAELSYFFSVDGNLEPRVEVFRINQMSGEIQTTNILDRETQAVYELTVSRDACCMCVYNMCVCVHICIHKFTLNLHLHLHMYRICTVMGTHACSCVCM